MRVLYIHQHYQENTGGTRSWHFSKQMQRYGHQVTLLTGQGETKIRDDGAKIVSTKTPYSQKMSIFKRLFAFLHFFIIGIFKGLKEKPDVIFASSTPLTVGVAALILSKIKRCPYIFEVRDVWPDIPVELGFIKNNYLKKSLFKLELLIYQHASQIIVLSEGMEANLLAKKIPAQKISVIENLADIEQARSATKEPLQDKMLEKWLKERFVIVHAGTFGYVNGVSYLVSLAEKVHLEGDLSFLFVGAGSEKAEIIKLIHDKKLTNCKVIDNVNKVEVYKILAHCRIGAVTVIDEPVLWNNSANKFFDYLAAKLPVVTNYPGWQKEVLTTYQAGNSFLYAEKELLINYLRKLAFDEGAYANSVKGATRLASKYSVSTQYQKLEKILRKVVQKNVEKVV